MISPGRISDLLDSPRAYALWQAPFVRSKLQPLVRHNDLSQARRVLELGCGPGTNASCFPQARFLGVDLNRRYIEHARRACRGEFVCADACTFEPPQGERFDCVLLNSFLHHIDDENSVRILSRLHGVLDDDGHIHILDLVLPERSSAARWLATHDRGDFARPLATWRQMLGDIFQPVIFEPYAVRACGVDLWQMVYFKGRTRI